MNEPDRKVKCNTFAVQVAGTAAAAADARYSLLARPTIAFLPIKPPPIFPWPTLVVTMLTNER